MTSIEMLLTVMLAGFGMNFALMFIMWRSLNERMDSLEKRIDRLSEVVLDIDRRLCRIEGAFSSREFCGIKNQEDVKKAE